MMNYSNPRTMKLRIYFTDSPSVIEVENVCHMNTEGGLLRIITTDGENQWWPLIHVFNIRQLKRGEA